MSLKLVLLAVLLILFFLAILVFTGLGYLLSWILPFSLFEATLLSLLVGILFTITVSLHTVESTLSDILEEMTGEYTDDDDDEYGEYKA